MRRLLFIAGIGAAGLLVVLSALEAINSPVRSRRALFEKSRAAAREVAEAKKEAYTPPYDELQQIIAGKKSLWLPIVAAPVAPEKGIDWNTILKGATVVPGNEIGSGDS